MKAPPIPLIPSGISPACSDVIGSTLLIQCVFGWGWTRKVGQAAILGDDQITKARIEIIPEAYVDFTAPRCGITGRVAVSPACYDFRRFVAFIMSDGVDYDFTENIAPCWRVIFGNGNLDLESSWFPILDGDDALFGYGTVGLNADWLQRSGRLIQNEQAPIDLPL